MRQSEKDEKIMMEIYKRAYVAATPQADFEQLVANATLDEHNRKIIPYDDYELDDNVAKQIIEDVMKEFKVPKWKRQSYSMGYWLGCSPKSKIK
jgi:diphthamide synthase subunit DPH2